MNTMLLLILSLSVASVSCKKLANESSDKSVEALVSGNALDARVDSECGPNDFLGKDANPNMHVEKAWKALPSGLSAWFSGPGSVQLFNEDNVCKKSLEDLATKSLLPKPETFEACWKVKDVSDPSKSLKSAVLHIEGKSAIIHRRLITTAVYAFAEYYFDGIITSAVKKSPKNPVNMIDISNFMRFASSFKSAREELAKAFVSEIKEREPIVKAISKVYGDNTEKWPENPIFLNFVLAEFVDAYYCNPATRAKLSEFSKTNSVFGSFVKEFGKPWYEPSL